MRSVTLPDSDRDVTVGVFHERIDIDYGDILPYSADTNYLVRRCTRVKLTDTQNTKFGDGQFEVRSICNPNDNFSKLQGRRLAAINLLRKLRDVQAYSKADRKAIFQAICPEFSGA
jgi:hypothetical protein